MMEITNLSAGYGAKLVVKDVSAQANAGEIIGLVGPNGSGKTTLLKTLLGLHKAESGEVRVSGQSLSSLPIKTRAKHMAYLAQIRDAAWNMSVRDVVTLGRAPYRGPLGRISETGQNAIETALEITQTAELSERNIQTLSGGEQARAFLARALAVQAPALLADEPIAALDPYYQLTMMGLLKAEAARGTLVITALHDLALAHQFCDRVWVMHEGQLVADGTPQTALSEDTLATVFGIKPPKGGFKPVELSL